MLYRGHCLITSRRSAIKQFAAAVALAMLGMTGCVHYAPEELHFKIYDEAEYFEDEALGISGVRHIGDDQQDPDKFPDLRKLMILKDNDKELVVQYSLRLPVGVRPHYIDSAYMNGKSLRFSFESRNVEDIYEGETRATSMGGNHSVEVDPTTLRNTGYHVENFLFAIPMESAIELSCDEEKPDRRVVLYGDGGYKQVTIHKYEIQGLLKRAKELSVVEIEGNCFDNLDIAEE